MQERMCFVPRYTKADPAKFLKTNHSTSQFLQRFSSRNLLPSHHQNSKIKDIISTTKKRNTQSHVFWSKKIIPILKHLINQSTISVEVQILSLRPVATDLYGITSLKSNSIMEVSLLAQLSGNSLIQIGWKPDMEQLKNTEASL